MTEGRHITMDALETKVGVLDNEVREVNTRLFNLDEKFDKVMTGFAEEFRAAITGLSAQFNERQKTPWGVLISGASVILAISITIGGLGISPIQSRIAKMEEDMVPRKEVEFRDKVAIDRINRLEDDLRVINKREQDRLVNQIDTLQRENSLLKSAAAAKN